MNRSAWLLLLIVLALPAHAQLFGENVARSGQVNDDLYVAGGTLTLDIDAKGDVIVAGGRVEVGRTVKGDVIAAGGSVDINGIVLDDVRTAGGHVNTRAQIRGDLVAAGGNLLLAPEASVGGRAWLAGGNVEVAGRVARELRIAANEARITGEVQGDVRVVAEELRIGPGAVIHGDLSYQSRAEAAIDPAARIDGTVTRLRAPMHREPQAGRAGAGILFTVSLALTAVVVYLLFPAFFTRANRTVFAHPWASLALGLAVLVTVPFVVVILFATVLGIPLGFLLLASYFIAIPVGLLTGIYFVADASLTLVPRATDRRGWRLAAIVAACLVLALIGLVPVLGGLVWFVLLLAGLGALSLTGFRNANPR